MQWRGRRQSDNVEDLRGRRVVRGGGGMVGIGGTGLVVILLLALLTGQNPLDMLGEIASQQQGAGGVSTGEQVDQPYQESGADQAQREFVSVVLADTEDVWNKTFREDLGRAYQEPRLVLFSGGVESGCGFAQAAVGPFYCPADQKVYIDLDFYDELQRRFGAPGDFAQAYVIAHEVGHHVQNLLGISGKVHAAQQRAGRDAANELSVRLELQADCLSGVWAHQTQRQKQVLERGDVEEALGAAAAVGDDSIQKKTQGYVVPESFTHGSAEQRVRWFKRGFESGSVDACDTFTG
ncbi:MAG: flagellar biosynthesis protein FlgM [Deltaproteobacteria bacterium]|nr:flagellar biosynthesis protein FlgM [Deltaproteobacteria bacterium]